MKRIASILILFIAYLASAITSPCPPIIFNGAQPDLLLLDTPGITQFPYTPPMSLRLLTTNYTGFCIAVMTNSVSTGGIPANIGFMTNAQGKILVDVAAIESFCGQNPGWLYQWYEQGTNSNGVSIGDTNYAPLICQNGHVITNNGMPAIYVNSVNPVAGMDRNPILQPDNISPCTNFTVFWVAAGASASGVQVMMFDSNMPMYGNTGAPNNKYGTYVGNYQESSYSQTSHRFFMSVFRNFDDIDFYVDNTAKENVTGGSSYYDGGVHRVFNFTSGYNWIGYVQELVVMDSSTNNVNIIKQHTAKFWKGTSTW